MSIPFADSGPNPIILIVDDVPENLTLISDLLTDRYRCKVATTGTRALSIAANSPQPDLILLDIIMPEMDGYAVCEKLKSDPRTAEIPVIFLTTMDSEEDEARGFKAGGVDYITKPVSRAVLNARVEAHLILQQGKRFLAHKNELLETMVEERSHQLSSMQDVIIMALASLAETRDSDTGAHLHRVQCYSHALAVAMRKKPRYAKQLTDNFIELLYKTSPLHDIGKVGVPDTVLFKPGRLTRDEYDEMKKHSFFGGQTLMEVERQLVAPAEFVSMAHDIALHHHERWDGTGYPLGLRGEEIPLSARIVALADTYDALTSARIYKPPYPSMDACSIIERERGRQFDPAVVDAFAECLDEFDNIARLYPDPAGDGARSIVLKRIMKDGQE